MINKFNIRILYAVIGIVLLYSCKSPLEIDSPNDPEPIVNYRIIPNMTRPIFDENGELRFFTVNKAFAQIDTMNNIPYVWMDFIFDSSQNTSFSQDSIFISQFSIKLDSLPIIPFVEDTLEQSGTGSWSSFIIGNSDSANDTLYSGMARNITSVSFSFDKGRKEMKAFIYASLIKKPSSEVSYFRATLSFKY